MRTRGALWYEARIAFGLSSALPVLLLPGYALVAWFVWSQRPQPPILWEVTRGFELVAPLAAALSAAHLMGVEREAGFADLRRSYPEHPWRLPLLRTAGAIGLGLLSLLLGILCFQLAYGTFSLWDTVLPALAPAVYLLGLSLLAGNLSGSYWLAAGAALGYWFVEMLTRGDITKGFFLFNETYPVAGVSQVLNRVLLAGIGLMLLIANGYVSARRVGQV